MTINMAQKETAAETAESDTFDYSTMLDDLLQLLDHATEEQPITRWTLGYIYGIDDRSVRRLIHDLRTQHHRVCMRHGAGGGYWLAKTDSEYQNFRRKYVAYAKDILATAKAMDEGGLEGQVEIGE